MAYAMENGTVTLLMHGGGIQMASGKDKSERTCFLGSKQKAWTAYTAELTVYAVLLSQG